eukprot:Rhum_TRINITY_DN20912_c0_g1::Rhum_TRINITY_DN20912_c0_g1_i1::g.172576::m.172576
MQHGRSAHTRQLVCPVLQESLQQLSVEVDRRPGNVQVRRHLQRRVLRRNPCAGAQQHAHHLLRRAHRLPPREPVRGGKGLLQHNVQRRVASARSLHVRVGPAGEQRLGRCQVAVARDRHQRRRRCARVDADALCEQQVEACGAALTCLHCRGDDVAPVDLINRQAAPQPLDKGTVFCLLSHHQVLEKNCLRADGHAYIQQKLCHSHRFGVLGLDRVYPRHQLCVRLPSHAVHRLQNRPRPRQGRKAVGGADAEARQRRGVVARRTTGTLVVDEREGAGREVPRDGGSHVADCAVRIHGDENLLSEHVNRNVHWRAPAAAEPKERCVLLATCTQGVGARAAMTLVLYVV